MTDSTIQNTDVQDKGLPTSDLDILETSDAILIADKSHSQKVKNIVSDLKKKGIQAGQTLLCAGPKRTS